MAYDPHIRTLFDQAGRVIVMAIAPTVLIPIASLLFSAAQRLLAVHEESMPYAVRTLAVLVVIALFGATVTSSFMELMQMALR